jgi:ABC-type enterochelin transport system permease subunit
MTQTEFDKLQNMINLKTIIISTISLALSTYLSNFLRLIIDKGVIQDLFKLKKKKKMMSAEEYIRRKDNPFTSFLGVIIGGIIFTIFYFINYQRYIQNQSFWTLNPLVLQTYQQKYNKNHSFS